MAVIILLIIISILVALGFLGIFIWAVKTGQFDDTVSPGIRILFDDKKHETSGKNNGEDDKSSS